MSAVVPEADAGKAHQRARWVPKISGHTFPSVDFLRYRAQVGERFFPVPDIPLPPIPYSNSSRVRGRQKSRLAVWRLASECLAALNGLSAGRCQRATNSCGDCDVSSDMAAAWKSVHGFLLGEAARLNKERRVCGLTGAQALEELLKRARADPYSRHAASSVAQVPHTGPCCGRAAC